MEDDNVNIFQLIFSIIKVQTMYIVTAFFALLVLLIVCRSRKINNKLDTTLNGDVSANIDVEMRI